MLVAFIGCDGSGKSTLANEVIKKFKKKKVRYKHQYNYFISSAIGNPIRKRNKISRNTKRTALHYKFWVFVVYPNLLFNWFVRKFIKRDEMFISDRYAYDLMVGWDLQGRLNPISRFILENFPKPDYVFLIDAKPKTLYKRRGDEYPSFRFCQRKRGLYLKLAKKKNIQIVSTDQPIKSSMAEIMDAMKK